MKKSKSSWEPDIVGKQKTMVPRKEFEQRVAEILNILKKRTVLIPSTDGRSLGDKPEEKTA